MVTSWHSRTCPFLFSVFPLRLLHRLPCSELRRCRELPTRRFTPKSMRHSTVLVLQSARTPCPTVRALHYSCRKLVGFTLVAGTVLASPKCTDGLLALLCSHLVAHMGNSCCSQHPCSTPLDAIVFPRQTFPARLRGCPALFFPAHFHSAQSSRFPLLRRPSLTI